MKRWLGRALLGGLILLVAAVPAMAYYYTYFNVTESNGTTYTQLAMNVSMNCSYLADEGYILPSGMDTRVTDSDLTVLPHMIAEDRVLWVDDLTGSTTTQFIFFTGQTVLNATPTITGHGGYVTVVDNASIELGSIWAVYVVGYVDTTSAARGPIVFKSGAIDFDITAVGQICFNVTGGNILVANNVTADWMAILAWCDGYSMYLEIDGVEVDNDSACSIPDTANNWTLFQNDCMPYVTYYGTWVA